MPKLGMNLRVTSDSKQGGRKYMEDVVCVEFHKGDDGETIEFVYFAVFDGHGGKEAACFAKDHLLKEITKHRGFWSDDDRHVLKAITDGFISTHKLMWKTVGLWPKRMNGQPSTAGTTASIAFLRKGKMYVGHVGDSGVVLGTQPTGSDQPQAHCVTVYHKPNSPEERKRIEENGGQVLPKAGVHRVVWNRPKALHSGPIRRSTQIDAIPFLAVARSLGDLWSYNSHKNVFVVSPEPDVYVYNLDPHKHKFVILASDGLWDMVKADEAANITHQLSTCMDGPYAHGSKTAAFLVRMSLDRWAARNLRADNTSVIVAYFDPPGTTSADLTRESSTLSNASTLLTSDPVDGSSSAALHDTELEFKVLIGHPDKFVSASTTGVESEQIDRHLKRDKQLSSDSAHPNIIQHKCIAAQPSGEAVAGCASVSVRQVASNITNSSHCLHKGDLSVACKDAESKHQQGLRPKSQVKSSSVSRQGTAPALVSPMWPTSMVSCVPLEGSGTKNALRQCRRKKPLRKAEENENEDKSHGGRVKRQHCSGACRPLKRRRTVATVKSRLLKTVIHRTRLHVKTAPRRS
ncbi:Protein phosphatase 1D [Lamellibrachia satsuma]|nr:Protein phosphatase 1D [Lamellibrachia satsuma]